MNVQAIIAEAIYKSLQDRQFTPSVNPGYSAFALFELNNILDEWRDKIPWAQELTFTNITELSNTQFVSVVNVNFVLNNVQTPLIRVSLTQFNEIQNVLGLVGIPQVFYFDELAQTILVYPGPANPSYSFTVWGRLSQQPLLLTDQVPVNMPRSMMNAVIYELAFRLTQEYGVPWDEKKEATRQKLIAELDKKNDIDVSAQRNIMFGRPQMQQSAPFPYFYYLSGGA